MEELIVEDKKEEPPKQKPPRKQFSLAYELRESKLFDEQMELEMLIADLKEKISITATNPEDNID